MILQNTTFVISEQIEDDFLSWLRSELAPAARKAAAYSGEPRFHLILANAEPGTKNFAFQLQAASLDPARQWLFDGEGAELLNALMRRFEGQVAHFSTFMDEIGL
ncbi:MAG: DUF4286 family protein [Muribaculaceae bacterium]|nr:DUF4286 family protein [Muribaculaceae bacterium]MDE7142358.1 DUF4286 family protein [Muribaculaceae bacterium]